MVTFGESISLAYRNSFNFTETATRSEFWWFYLFNVLASILFQVAGAVMPPLMLGYMLFAVISIPANISIVFRRVRDAGGSILWIIAFWAFGGAFAYVMFDYMGSAMFVPQGPGGQVEMAPFPMIGMILGGLAGICNLVVFVYTLLPSRD